MPQFDRFISTRVVHPLIRTLRRFRPESGLKVPILMYHSITDEPEPNLKGYYRLNTPPELFREHLRILRDEGFSTVDLHTAMKAMGSSDKQTSRLAVITFDDGFRDFHTRAWPVLAEFNATATMFLATEFIGTERRQFKGQECLTWAEVGELARAGMTFGSHTVSHPKLWELSEAELRRELRESRRVIEEQTGLAIDTFAHPYAFPATDQAYVKRFKEILAEAGYCIGVTTALGRARGGDDRLTLKRLPANGADDAALFRSKLAGAYDWLAVPQRAFKAAKSSFRRTR